MRPRLVLEMFPLTMEEVPSLSSPRMIGPERGPSRLETRSYSWTMELFLFSFPREAAGCFQHFLGVLIEISSFFFSRAGRFIITTGQICWRWFLLFLPAVREEKNAP